MCAVYNHGMHNINLTLVGYPESVFDSLTGRTKWIECHKIIGHVNNIPIMHQIVLTE